MSEQDAHDAARAGKHPDFIVFGDGTAGFNGAMPLDRLTRAVRTPTSEFFVRSHGPVPHIDPAAYTLTLGGLLEPRTWTLDSLKAMPSESITAVLACAGNRRAELHAHAPIAGELLWDAHAVGSATWTGVRLSTLLDDTVYREDAFPDIPAPADDETEESEIVFEDPPLHIAFTGADVIAGEGGAAPFSGSIEMRDASDVLIAWAMNGEPLPPAHGFPVRAVVPGYIGARSVKWLTHIEVQAMPSAGFFQQERYRMTRPGADMPEPGGVMLGRLEPNAAITTVRAQPNGDVLVRGYAYGGPEPIVRIEVQADDEPWRVALLVPSHYPNARLAWRVWERAFTLPAGPHTFGVRAFDEAMWPPPEYAADVWNAGGYMNNAVHRVRFVVP